MELKKPGERYLQKPKTNKTEKAEKEEGAKSTKKASGETSGGGGKGKAILVVVALIVLAAVGYGVYSIVGKENSNKEQLEKDLETMGRDFYEEFYYEQIATSQEGGAGEFLAKFSSLGIKIDLINLEQYPSKNLENKSMVDGFKNSKTDEECNSTETRATIYPQEPYGKGDYRIETSLVCGFD